MLKQIEKDHKVSYNSLMKSAQGNPFYALSQYSSIVRRAAAKTRNLLLEYGENIHAVDCLSAVMSRAHFSNDFPLANFLIANYSLAREHLAVRTIQGSLLVCLRSPAQFSEIISKHRHAWVSSDIEYSQKLASNSKSSTVSRKARAKVSFLSSVLQRWVPISIFLNIPAILGADNEIVCTSTPRILGSLVQYWKPIFDGSNGIT